MGSTKESARPRWWPAAVIIGMDAAYTAYVWLIDNDMRQNRVLSTLAAQLIAFVLLVAWLALFSRIRLKLRLLLLSGLGALGLLAIFSLEIRDVSGDLMPIVSWRWSPPSEERLAAVAKTAAADATVDAIDATGAFPQFLGPNRNGVVEGVALARDWQANPPKVLWRQPIGAGWSGFAIFGNRAVTQEQRGEDEMVSCYDLGSGELIWAHADAARYETTLGGVGPRATPAIDNGRVYALGAKGQLNCLDLATGERLWAVNILEDNNGRLPQWGYAGSPLTTERLVVVSPGGPNGRSLTAYDKLTGAFVWGGGDGAPGYSSPQLRVLAGAPQIIILNTNSVAAHDPETGSILWEEPWGRGSPSAANPLLLPGDRLLVSSGYGVGCTLYQAEARGEGGVGVRVLYSTTRLKAKFANFVLFGDHVYGLDDGVLVCLDIADGQRAWKRGRYGHGQLLLVGDLLLLQAEEGSLRLIEPSPLELRELGQIKALDGKAWNNLALSGNRLLMRNHEEAVCFELALR